MEPTIVQLPKYSCVHRVLGVERRSNHGPMLTLAIAEWHREGFATWHRVTDIVTRMRLADATSDKHDEPINAVRLYGPNGRQCQIGRVSV